MSSTADAPSRFALPLVAYAFAVTMAGTTLPTPLYPIYAAKYGFSPLLITVIFATYAVGVVATLVLAGQISDEVGRRRTLLVGLSFSAASAVAFLLAEGLAPLMVGRVLSGVSAGIFTGTATATLLDLVDEEGRPRATLVATVANMGGLGLGPLLAGLLAEFFADPLRLPFWVHLGLLAAAALGVLLIAEPGEIKAHPSLRPRRIDIPRQMRAVFLRAGLAALAGFSVLGLTSALSPAFLGEVIGVTSEAIVGLVVFSIFLGSAVGQLALGTLVAEERALPIGCALLIVGAALLAVGLAVGSLACLIAGDLVAGFGQGLSFRSGLGAVNAAAPAERRAEIASAFFVVAYFAISVPVVGEGVLVQLTDLKTAGLVFLAAVAALCALVLGLLSRGESGEAGRMR